MHSLDIDTIITFDRDGVSHHENHCAIYYSSISIYVANLLHEGTLIIFFFAQWCPLNCDFNVVLAICFSLRLSPFHPGLGECVPKVYICLWSAAEHGIVEQLVCAELAWFLPRATGYVGASLANGMVSSTVHPIQPVHCHQYTARGAHFRCWAGNPNYIATKEERLMPQTKHAQPKHANRAQLCTNNRWNFVSWWFLTEPQQHTKYKQDNINWMRHTNIFKKWRKTALQTLIFSNNEIRFISMLLV